VGEEVWEDEPPKEGCAMPLALMIFALFVLAIAILAPFIFLIWEMTDSFDDLGIN